jgi:pimeloyl-ACP methyl ester carboxylesterase
VRASTPKSVRIRSHRIEISLLDYGSEGAPPILLLHGMRDLAWSLDPVARALEGRYRAVSLDLRGHGDSDHVGYYALAHFVIDVRAAIRSLALERPILLGHSFGGEVAAQFAGLFPEVPRACILLEGLGPPPWEGEGSREAGLFWARNAIEALDAIDLDGRSVPSLEAASERIRKNHPRLNPERAAFLADVGTRPHPRGGLSWKWDPFLRTSWGTFNFRQMEEVWERIRCPVLAVNGAASGSWWKRDSGGLRRGGETESYLPPAELERRLSFFQDIECVEIPDAGHMLHFDQPELLNREIEAFLERRSLR